MGSVTVALLCLTSCMPDGSILQVFMMILIAPALLTMQRSAKPVMNGAVVIRNSMITAVGPADGMIKRYPGHRLYRLGNAVLMPGIINLHTHLELPALLESVRAGTFPDWVLNLINAKRRLANSEYESAAALNIRTLIQSGTTTVGEICTHGVSPGLLKRSGLRAVVFHEIISMGPPFPAHLWTKATVLPYSPHLYPLPSGERAGVRGDADMVGLLHIPRPPCKIIQAGISPHAPHTVSEAVLLRIREVSRKKNLRLAMHVAESKNEIRLLQGIKSGFEKLYRATGWDPAWLPSTDSPFPYLHRLGLLNKNFLAVHAVHATDSDIRLIRKTRTSVAHCPRSNRETGVGKMSLKKFLDTGIIVGLGTDSLASSPSLNMWDEMRYAYQTHRRNGIRALDILRLATTGGAEALGMDKDIGTLEPGKKADLIAVNLPKKNTGDLYSDLLRETESCIMSVVNGKILWTDPGFTMHDSR